MTVLSKNSSLYNLAGRTFLAVVLLSLITFDGMLQQDTTPGKGRSLEEFVTVGRAPTNDSFCVPWTTKADDWWTHAPEWEMGQENDTHYCFQRIQNERKRKATVKLYQAQFEGNCSNVLTKRVWSSGWNADFINVLDGFKHAVTHNRPVQMVNRPWHYADPRSAKPGIAAYKTIDPVCPKGNMFCYFLPYSNCEPADHGDDKDLQEAIYDGTDLYQWYYEFATRRQTWLRKAVYDFRKKQTITTPCTAIHVRRGDVVLHPGDFKRRYFPIGDYLNESFHVKKNIFLMTDDANAIVEAKTEFPEYNWMYVDRPRFKASEGGFEMQLPSLDPVHEVVVILSVFQIARQCSQLIHSFSTFATQAWAEIKFGGNHPEYYRIQIDQGSKIWSGQENADTHNVSKAYEQ